MEGTETSSRGAARGSSAYRRPSTESALAPRPSSPRSSSRPTPAATKVEAVRGVDLEVHAGEIFGFLGPNGAGKSTTVRMLTTLLTITAGRAEVAGVDVAREPDGARRRIGVALQEAGLDPRQTGRELLVLHGRLFGLDAARGQGAGRAAAGAGRARGRRRPRDQGLLGRHGAPARPRGGARPPARGPLPRRADHRPRSGEPADGLGGAAPDQRARARPSS